MALRGDRRGDPTRAVAAGHSLLSDGPSMFALDRRCAYYVDRNIKGAGPGDRPVEQPTTFALVINLQTAQALGLTIPSSVLQQGIKVVH